jgi:hypothetical protein
MNEQTTNPELELLQHMASELDGLQQVENEGRGISCVRTVVTYLKRGELSKAQAVCFNESDKMRYDAIQKFIVENLFKDKSHPWTLTYKG